MTQDVLLNEARLRAEKRSRTAAEKAQSVSVRASAVQSKSMGIAQKNSLTSPSVLVKVCDGKLQIKIFDHPDYLAHML